MNGTHKLADVKLAGSQHFDWEHSSRNTGQTVPGLFVDDDGTFKLECWLGLTPKFYTKDPVICKGADSNMVALALEDSNGDWFWMHISNYSEE